MKNFFLLLSILPFFVFCGVVSAQEYTLLEPGVYNDQFTTIDSKTSFSDYLNLVFKVGIGIAAGLAVIQIVIGGIQYMASESPFKLGDAKSKIQGAILGLILALGIYIFLYTINPDLVSLNLNVVKTAPSMTGGAQSVVSGPVGSAQNQEKLADILRDEQKIRDLLLPEIGVNKKPCQTYGQQNCTNVGLLPTRVVTQLKKLADSCGCVVVVSGGTEWWLHKTHSPYYPIVDILKNPALNSWVKSTDTSNVGITTKKIYTRSISNGGGSAHFYDEDAVHYHVTFF